MGDRYYIVFAANEFNRIDEVSEAADMPLVGIADEEAGGIIGYVSEGSAARVLEVLNA